MTLIVRLPPRQPSFQPGWQAKPIKATLLVKIQKQIQTRPSSLVDCAKDSLVWSGLVTIMLLCMRPFWHGDDKRPTHQPGDPRVSLLLTFEKAVFCNKDKKDKL